MRTSSLRVVQTKAPATTPLYDGWLSSLLGGEIPAETNATCNDCAMCNATAAPQGNDEWFNPNARCCTYVPRLSNFLVGRVLLDNDPQSKPSMEQRLAGATVSPLGLLVPAEYSHLYRQFPARFGRSQAIRCPHYLQETGRCAIWQNRNSVCATWFCKHVRGSVGLTFWQSLLKLLQVVEQQLEIWCVLKLQRDQAALSALFPVHEIPASKDAGDDLPPNSPRYKAIWGEWLGKERSFFIECARLVSELNWKDVLQLGGQEVATRARNAASAYRDLRSREIPSALRMGDFSVISMDDQSIRLNSYRGYDPVQVPRELFDVLGCFDGRPTATVLKAIAREHNLKLTPDLLRGLVDFKILESADD